MSLNEKWPQNAPGAYSVDMHCIDCGRCRNLCPTVFVRNNQGIHSYVKRQPTTPKEIEECDKAIACCPAHAIHKE